MTCIASRLAEVLLPDLEIVAAGDLDRIATRRRDWLWGDEFGPHMTSQNA
ncbi:hypothetical protein [Planctomyces sp. SH-PL14]|jgi:hypothetical protein|nr:hypothetical protein [Planctomyces sp. SH-PL14]AMV21997.1 hypothetical protein VT03_29110 [Planctomyces sp. SH-PL14]